MELARSLIRRYVRNRFTVLFVALAVAIAGHGLAGAVLPVANPLEWLIGIGLVAVVFSARRGWLRWLLGGLVTASVAGRLAQGLLDDPVPVFVGQLCVALACVLAAGVAIRRALASGPVDAEHICAALDAYLLVGIAFGVAYWMLEAALPGSFASVASDGLTPARAIYFSFVTQTTLGYGEITPLGEPAQGLVIAQGVGGQIYLVVLVARLVTLYSEQEKV